MQPLMSINSWIDKAWAIGQWKTANQWRLPVQAEKPCSYLKQC